MIPYVRCLSFRHEHTLLDSNIAWSIPTTWCVGHRPIFPCTLVLTDCFHASSVRSRRPYFKRHPCLINMGGLHRKHQKKLIPKTKWFLMDFFLQKKLLNKQPLMAGRPKPLNKTAPEKWGLNLTRPCFTYFSRGGRISTTPWTLKLKDFLFFCDTCGLATRFGMRPNLVVVMNGGEKLGSHKFDRKINGCFTGCVFFSLLLKSGATKGSLLV